MAAGAMWPSLDGQRENLDPGDLATRSLRYDDNSARPVIGEQPRRRRQFAARIDDDARGIGADDVAHRQSRVIGEGAADADDDRVDEGAQPVQMRETGGPIDVAR